MLLLYLVLAFTSLRGDAVTVDEFAHLPAGYNLLRTGDYRYCEYNPPLMNVLSALPLVLGGAKETGPPMPMAPEDRFGFWVNGYDFLSRFQGNYHSIFIRARAVTVILVGLLGLLLYYWARWLTPAPPAAAGLIAAGLVWFSPTVLANARLVTTDAGAACFLALAVFAFHHYLRGPGLRRALLAGLALGLAQIVKFHAIYLYPVLGVFWLARRLRSGDRAARVSGSGELVNQGSGAGKSGGRYSAAERPQLRPWLLEGLVILAASVLVIDLGYLFREFGAPSASFALTSGPMRAIQDLTPGWMPVLWPKQLILAFDRQLADAAAGDPSFLFGRSYEGGRWYYFPALWLVKTPLPELVLSLGAILVGLRRRTITAFRSRLLLAPVVVMLLAFSLLSEKQLGLRMLLPAAPFFALWTGVTLGERLRQRRPLIAIALLCALFIGESVRAHPQYISCFNQLGGGPSRGFRYALDSNLDWGQDLIRLRRYQEENGIESIQLLYFGRVAPEIYGVRYTVPVQGLSPGLVAVSVSLYGRPYLLYDHGNLVNLPQPVVIGRDIVGERVATVGHTIHVYRVGGGS
jgi:hypothetical protein